MGDSDATDAIYGFGSGIGEIGVVRPEVAGRLAVGVVSVRDASRSAKNSAGALSGPAPLAVRNFD